MLRSGIKNKYFADYSFFLPVFNPNGRYRGQKLTRLVSTNTAASTRRTIPKVPVITLVKYNIATSTAIAIRIILSVVPMFDFIARMVLGEYYVKSTKLHSICKRIGDIGHTLFFY